MQNLIKVKKIWFIHRFINDGAMSGKAFSIMPLPVLLVCLLFLCSSIQGQTWTAIQALLATRVEHGAATGSDGIVYIVGGKENETSGTPGMEKYNPLLGGNWVAAASMSTPRISLAFVFGTDGYLYAIGGNVGNTSTNTVERYNTATGAWTTMAPMNMKRSQLAAAVGPDGRIYAIGGYNSPIGTSNLNTVEVYNPPSTAFPLGQWVPAPSLITPLANHHAVTGLDGNIYVFDGGSGNKWFVFNGTQWTAKGALDSSLGGCAAVTGPDGLMYLLDVEPNLMTGSKLVAAYTPDGLWETPIPNLIQGRTAPGAGTAAEGNIFVTGGYRKLGGILNYAEKYGPLKAPDFAPNCKALWRFNVLNNNTTPDSKGSNTGIAVGQPSLVNGRVTKSVKLNGSSQYIKANNAPSLNFGTSNMTIECWIKWSPVNGNKSVITILDKRTLTAGKYKGYSLFITAAGKLGVQLANGVTYQNYVATETSVQANEWTHVAATIDRDPLNPGVTLFVNSVKDKTFTPLQGDITNTAPLNIGKHLFSNVYYKGELDELTLYNRALRWAEIRAIFLAGKEGKL